MSNSLPPRTPLAAPAMGVKAEVDDMIRTFMVLSNGAEKEFLTFVEKVEVWMQNSMVTKMEVVRLQTELMKSQAEVTRLEKKLKNAQHLLGTETEKRVASEHQIRQIIQMMEKLKAGPQNPKGDDTQERLFSLLSSTLDYGGLMGSDGHRGSRFGLETAAAPLSTIDESADTLDAVSDIDLTDGDDLECSSLLQPTSGGGGQAQRTSTGQRRSSRKRTHSLPSPSSRDQEEHADRRKQPHLDQDCDVVMSTPVCTVTTTTTVAGYQPSAPPLGADEWGLSCTPVAMKRKAPVPPTPQPCTPLSQYSTPPQSSPMLRHLSASRGLNRPHCFYTKSLYMSEHCQPCGKRVKFGKSALKCRDCRALCHHECRNNVPLPCVPTAPTPGGNNKHALCTIADFAPKISPMVPALIVHCTLEVEQRGGSEVGVYRVSAVDRDVKELKEQFLRGKGLPNLSQVDIHVICGTVKHFLRGLKEPLVTFSHWQQFVNAANLQEDADREAALYQCIAELPQPNRDTIAWMILHLQRVSEAEECKMTVDNLARMFGPTLVGYSMSNPEPQMVLMQTADQQTVMSLLLSISRDYWEAFTRPSGSEHLFSGSINVDVDLQVTPGNERRSNRRTSLISSRPIKN